LEVFCKKIANPIVDRYKSALKTLANIAEKGEYIKKGNEK